MTSSTGPLARVMLGIADFPLIIPSTSNHIFLHGAFNTARIMLVIAGLPLPNASTRNQLFNRPGVTGAVLQTPLSLIISFIESYFSSKSSEYHKLQTIRARELQFERMLTPQHVTCHMSHAPCYVSHVTCHLLHVIFFLSLKKKIYNVAKLIGGGSVINGAYPV